MTIIFTVIGNIVFISSAKVTSTGVVTLTAAAKGKLIIDGTLDIECNY